jgi:hypothetical protein
MREICAFPNRTWAGLADKYHMPVCIEKAKLLREWEDVATTFRQSLNMVNTSAATASDEQFSLIRRSANELDAKLERTLLVLKKHIGEHGC